MERRYDIDWLRVFATYLLFPFHIGKVFDVPPEYHIKNAELSWNIAYFTTFVHQWHMPLFFLLAGWSLYESLRLRGTGAVLQERVKRIFLPFVFGCCTLCVGLGYIEKILMPHKDVSFWSYVPMFFTDLDYFTWGHLWFLIYLFTFTLLYMPVFARLRRPSTVRYVKAGWLYAPLLPLIVMQFFLRIKWPGHQNLYDDWGNFAYYSSFLFFGFMMARIPAVEDAIGREWKRAGAMGVIVSLLFLLTYRQAWNLGLSERSAEVVSHFQYHILGTSTGWLLLIGMLGFARAHLQFSNRWLKYLAESALPVYIIHQEAITYPGWFVINLSWSPAAKIALLLPLSVVLALTTYHFVVRPFNPLRILFGMKPLRPAERQAVPATA